MSDQTLKEKLPQRLYNSNGNDIEEIFQAMLHDLTQAPRVDTGHWQSKKDVPQVLSRELMNVDITIPIPASPGAWASYMKPNLSWTEDHFLERVGGEPLNPPPSHVNWPYNQQGNADHMDGEVFSHSYPERLWPRHAPTGERSTFPNFGIRYEYGDLSNAVDILVAEPHTRQCFIPLWFPEDLWAASHGQRVPCTLGYHMMLRNRRLHCFYPMRSLDVLRYFRDDAYMAGRLVQWVIGKCHRKAGANSEWAEVWPGTLTMHAVSCHIFDGDLPIITQLQKKAAA